MTVQHARPTHPLRHARSLRGLLGARFGLLALVPAVVLGLGAGAATGMGLRSTGSAPVDSVQATAGPARTTPDSVRVTPNSASASASDGVGDGSRTVAQAELVPEPSPDAVPIWPTGVGAADAMAGLLSLDTPLSADGDLVVVPGSTPAPDPDAPVKRVRVEVEAGLAVDGERFATLVMGILNHPQGWGHDGAMSFARTDGEDEDLRVVLASPDKVDAMCAPLDTGGTYSCGRYGHAAINFTRWVTGAEDFESMTQYRQYVINHEVGHLLGQQHVSCPGAGEVAPLMQQQSISVAPCTANGWAYPDEA